MRLTLEAGNYASDVSDLRFSRFLFQSSTVSRFEATAASSREDASSIFRCATVRRCVSAAAVSFRLPEATASARCTRPDRMAAGSESEDSQCFAAVERALVSAAAIVYGGSSADARRPATRHAKATSRSPPSDARPAHVASARKRKRGVASAKGGRCPITGSNLGIH